MRTVDDLRAALVSLEDEAPAVEELLSKPFVAPRRPAGRWLLPVAAAAVTIAVVLAAAGLVALRSGSGRLPSATGRTGDPAIGHGRLLPFRLTSALPDLRLVDVQSEVGATEPFGTAVVAEYGMEVTIDVSILLSVPARSASASRVAVGDVEGWIDVSCGVRAAARSSSSAPGSPRSSVNPTCSLTYDRGPWHVAIYVAGPGGGSRKITSRQFLEIGNHLQLAGSVSDRSTWFGSDELLPK